ncbi:MAG TPA: serine/threonine-protein kinase [Crinalium sp.]
MTEPSPGELLDKRYRIIRPLALGSFGQTYVAEDTRLPNNPECVVKYLKPASTDPELLENARRLFRTEAEALLKLGKYDQIPQLLAFFEENQDFYLVQELIRGHTLSQELTPGHRWPEGDVVELLHEVLSILNFLHEQGIIHRDIKPDNIIRRSRDHRLVLVDFGSVKEVRSHYSVMEPSMAATIAAGTPGYMPTEQSHGKPRPNSDIYALGITAIQALTGLYPSQLGDEKETGEVLWRPWAECSDELAHILSQMVRYHFKERYQTAAEVLDDLKRLVTLMSARSKARRSIALLGDDEYLAPRPKSTIRSASRFIAPSASGKPSTPPQSKPTVVSWHSPVPEVDTEFAALPSDVPNLSNAEVGDANSLSEQPSTEANSRSDQNGLHTAQTIAADPAAFQQSETSVSSPQAFVSLEDAVRTYEASTGTADNALEVESSSDRLKAELSTSSNGSSNSSSNGSSQALLPYQTQEVTNTLTPRIDLDGANQRSSRPSRLWMVAGVGLGIAVAIAGVSYVLYQQDWQKTQLALAQVKRLQESQNFEQCRQTAQTIPDRHEAVYLEAQRLAADCTLAAAKQLASATPARYKDAILLASQIPSGTPVYDQAEPLIQEWGNAILAIATDKYRQGHLEEAIGIASSIPNQTSAAETAKQSIQQWQNESQKNQEILAQAQQALEQREWQQAIDLTQTISLLGEPMTTDIPFWKTDVQPVIDQAQQGIRAAEQARIARIRQMERATYPSTRSVRSTRSSRSYSPSRPSRASSRPSSGGWIQEQR